MSGGELDDFVTGLDLNRDVVSFMPHLRQFSFHIRSMIRGTPNTSLDTIRQSFTKEQQQSIDCALDHFNNGFSQCHIYSLPFIGTRLEFVSNRFPLFNGSNNRFSMVTTLLLFDDVQSFEHVFFSQLAQALPHLETLEIWNKLRQQQTPTPTENHIEFTDLHTLILFDIHIDYAQ